MDFKSFAGAFLGKLFENIKCFDPISIAEESFKQEGRPSPLATPEEAKEWNIKNGFEL